MSAVTRLRMEVPIPSIFEDTVSIALEAFSRPTTAYSDGLAITRPT